MKVLVSGANGQLGHDVMEQLKERGHEAIGMDIAGDVDYIVDITRPEAKDTVKEIAPDAIIHCAAWTAVDAAEEEENKDKVYAINVTGTRILCDAAADLNCKLLYLSTDYVFNGQGTEPWKPDDKSYDALSYYGETKLKGEFAVSELEKFFIVRIAWVFGRYGKNFINTMLKVAETHDTVRVVNDQIGTPTYTYDLARLLIDMIETEKYGYYHATNSESAPGQYISWADLAEECYKAAGMKVKVERVSTTEYGLSKAARPENSRLDKGKLAESGFKPLPDWRDAIARYVKEAQL